MSNAAIETTTETATLLDLHETADRSQPWTQTECYLAGEELEATC
jgi:hypothetical protein